LTSLAFMPELSMLYQHLMVMM